MKKYPVVDSQSSLTGTLEVLHQTGVKWAKAMLVADKSLTSVCVFLIEGENKIVGGFKPNFDADTFDQLYTDVVAARDWITTESVEDLSVFEKHLIPDTVKIQKLGKRAIRRIFKKPARPKSTGRKGTISQSTAHKVFQQSHMRCMFKGCAKRLDEHSLIGEAGYFGYLAHIIPASENGPRGNEAKPGECERLVDQDSNIMLLCDECHRLVDRVAVSDYPRVVLDRMREDFLNAASECLDQLSYTSAPVAEFLWPIGKHHVGVPSPIEIQNCLSPLGIRWNGKKIPISDKNSNNNDTKSRDFWNCAPRLLNLAKRELETLVTDNPTLGLFAGGPMPALMALGALVGNKIRITPMLNSRSAGGWCWPRKDSYNRQFRVLGLEDLNGSSEIVLQLNLTQKTDQQKKMRLQLEKEHDCQSVFVDADEMGNECFAHHEEALLFQNAMTKILTHLKSSLGVSRVHVLPCASNLACVHFGRSIEQYCPEVRIYDFLTSENGETSMYPVLDIIPGNEGVTICPVAE